MSGIEIQYLLGLYFLITAIVYSGGHFSADAVRLIASVILLLLAFFSKSLI